MKLTAMDIRVGSANKKPLLNMRGNIPSLFDTRLAVGEYYVLIGIGDKTDYTGIEVTDESKNQQFQTTDRKGTVKTGGTDSSE